MHFQNFDFSYLVLNNFACKYLKKMLEAGKCRYCLSLVLLKPVTFVSNFYYLFAHTFAKLAVTKALETNLGITFFFHL